MQTTDRRDRHVHVGSIVAGDPNDVFTHVYRPTREGSVAQFDSHFCTMTSQVEDGITQRSSGASELGNCHFGVFLHRPGVDPQLSDRALSIIHSSTYRLFDLAFDDCGFR